MQRHRFLTVGLAVFAFIFAQGAIGQTAMGPLRPEGVAMSDANAPQPVRVMVGRSDVTPFQVAPPANFAKQPKTSTFTIQYLNAGEVNYYGDVCVGWPTEAKAAFTYAANIWGTLLNSTVPIKISACWANMGTGGILGHGGARSYYMDFTGAPQASTYYPVATANALYGSDLNGDTEEIVIAYNAQFTSWYYGTDGVCPSTKIDFAQVIMHEMCHGLGFIGSMSVSGGLGYWGLSGYPTIYDRYAEDGSGNKLISYASGSVVLYNELTSGNVYFNGANANAGNGGAKVKLYAPYTWASGSSYAHLDEIFNGTANAMMTYSVNYGEAIHNPGPVTLGILKDNGWTGETPPPITTGAINDYDGDGKTDYSLYGWMNGRWSIWSSRYGRFLANGDKWGDYLQLPVSGDFNGGGTADIAVYSLDDGYWYIYFMETGTYSISRFGGYGYCPVAGDYDGDGKTDYALYCWPNSCWYIWSSLYNRYLINGAAWGAYGDIPVTGDFDGDGKADIAVYSEDSSYWSVYFTGTGLYSIFQWGTPGCRPACADYDGDGKTDYALYYWPQGYWYIWSSLYSRYLANGDKWGSYGDIPVTGDFDGDGKADIAVYSENSGYWQVYFIGSGLYSIFQWGEYGYSPPYDWVWYY